VAAVAIERVVKAFGSVVAVDALDLNIDDKEFVVLLGPSGCGKTTTLNMIAGLDSPTTGHIRFDGTTVEHLPPERRDISMVFQSIALYPHKSVYDNIAFPLRMAGRPRAEIDQRVRNAARLLKIEGLLDRRPHQLSGGQRQRAALGRAVVRDPAVFLFDEPLSALDAKLRVEMRIEIKKLHERLGATFVYVTHDQVEALTMADRIAVMDAGRLQQYGTPDEVYRRPVNVTVARFVGSPSMNLVRGTIRESEGVLTFTGKGLAVQLAGAVAESLRNTRSAEVLLGVRPEGAMLNEGAPNQAGTGWVYATEPVGSDLFVDLSFEPPETTEPELFKVRTRPDLRLRSGERVSLSLPLESLYVFEASGRRIHPREPAS
jgi:multiple sugar transport system ATP-binding protein